jgi:hypothetical protein
MGELYRLSTTDDVIDRADSDGEPVAGESATLTGRLPHRRPRRRNPVRVAVRLECCHEGHRRPTAAPSSWLA